MIQYLTVERVEETHAKIIHEFGGLHGIRSRNLLLSALDAPKAAFGGTEMYPSLLEKGAVYLYHLIKNHPFNDGNKRTAYSVTLAFLKANNVPVQFDGNLEEIAVRVAEGLMSKNEVIAFFVQSQVLELSKDEN